MWGKGEGEWEAEEREREQNKQTCGANKSESVYMVILGDQAMLVSWYCLVLWDKRDNTFFLKKFAEVQRSGWLNYYKAQLMWSKHFLTLMISNPAIQVCLMKWLWNPIHCTTLNLAYLENRGHESHIFWSANKSSRLSRKMKKQRRKVARKKWFISCD